MPKEKFSQSSDEDENEAVEDTGDVGEVDELAGDMGDYIPELPTQVGQLLDIDNSLKSSPTSEMFLLNLTFIDWISEDTLLQDLPSSSVSPTHMEDFGSDAKFFMKMFDESNFTLITYHTNIYLKKPR